MMIVENILVINKLVLYVIVFGKIFLPHNRSRSFFAPMVRVAEHARKL
jgi:hypothetical protein